jgi:hypothetical protein
LGQREYKLRGEKVIVGRALTSNENARNKKPTKLENFKRHTRAGSYRKGRLKAGRDTFSLCEGEERRAQWSSSPSNIEMRWQAREAINEDSWGKPKPTKHSTC